MNRCQKCILPENYVGIKFDDHGTCNYCNTYREREYLGGEALKREVKAYGNAQKNFNDEYDCILGFSGGKDSTYLLYYLVKILNLRVLCYSADNGFIPEQTLINMKNVTDMLGVKLVIDKHDYLTKCIKHHIKSWIKHPSAAMTGVLCVGCRMGIYPGLNNFAKSVRIPIVILGGTPIDSQTGYKYNIMRHNPSSRNRYISFIIGYIHKILQNPSWILNMNCLKTQIEEYYNVYYTKTKKDILKIAPFYTHIKWTEREVLSTIEKELGWEKNKALNTSSRGDCNIAILKAYLYRKTLGYNDKDCELSALIRDNQISREEALIRLDREGSISEELVESIIDDMGLDYHELRRSLSMSQLTDKKTLNLL